MATKESPLNKDQQEQVKALELKITQVTRTDSILNENQVQKIFNSTPRKYKYRRPAKGGGEWTYVKTSYVRRVLDSIFGFNWDFEIETSLAEAFEVTKITGTCVVKGILIGRVKVDGKYVEIRKTQFGRSEVKFKTKTENGVKTSDKTAPLDFGNDMKAATSDALKKCASLLGIAADIYEAEEFQEIEIIGSEDHSDRRKNQDKLIKDAKATLKQQSKEVK